MKQAGVTGTSSSPIARAVAELETEKANLLARAAKVDEAIANLRALFHLPAERNIKIPDLETGNSKGDKAKDAIHAALKAGPLPASEIATRLGLSKSAIGYHVRQMQADGVVKFIGVGRATTVALASAAAKEEL